MPFQSGVKSQNPCIFATFVTYYLYAMNSEIRNLQPNLLWNKFADLNAIPRASKKEERVITFMKDFGTSLGLETIVDAVGNVIIKKPATPGMENRTTIVMQSHLDMVHQKDRKSTRLNSSHVKSR